MANTRKTIRKIHLWLGLITSLPVFVVSLTGAIYAFEAEIRDLTQEYRHVEPRQLSMLPPSVLREEAHAAYPDHHLHSLAYGAADKAVEAVFYEPDPLVYRGVYLDPYTGDVIGKVDFTHEFFWVILQGHYYLWLPPVIGQPLVAYSTLIFFFILITGLYLWWPKNKKVRKQRLRFSWKSTTRWRRKNFDLHTVLGFYAWIFALVFALTGLIWGITWIGASVYTMAGGEKSLQYYEPQSVTVERPIPLNENMDVLWKELSDQYPHADHIDMHIPTSDSASIYVNIKHSKGTYWRTDFRFFDQHTMEELETQSIYGKMENATPADKLIRMNYDIHVGAILGFPGKVLAFLASLVIASLPVTGILIYFGRKRKKR